MNDITKVSIAGVLLVSILATHADDSIQPKDDRFLPRKLLAFFRPKFRNDKLEAGEMFFFDESVKDKNGVSKITRYYELKHGSESVIIISTLSADALRDHWLGDSNLCEILMNTAQTLDSIRDSEQGAISKVETIEQGSYYPRKHDSTNK